jgi:predicted transcriptional regulator
MNTTNWKRNIMKNENPFKKIGNPPKEVPTDLKKKIMDDVNSAKLIMEVTSLFSSNFAETLESFLKNQNKTNKK